MKFLKNAGIKSPARRSLRELSATEIRLVSGGINSQPLPPNHPPELKAK